MTYTGINDNPSTMDCDGNPEHYDVDRCRLCVSERECREEQVRNSDRLESEEISREEIAELLARESEEMTREEALEELDSLLIPRDGEQDKLADAFEMAIKALEQEPCEDWYDVPSYEMTLEQARQAVKDLRKKLAECLEQEPCEDEYIKVPKKALKYRTAGMVAYNAEWLRNHFDIERAVICGAQQHCDDAISRQAVLDLINADWKYEGLEEDVSSLPPVTPKQRTGHWEWVQYDYSPKLGNWHCSECRCVVVECVNKEEDGGIPLYKYCPQCGAKMESEV